MSDDDDDVVYVKKLKRVHYGSLEEQERAKMVEKKDSDDEQEPQTTTTPGNVHVSDEYMDLEDEMSKDRAALLEEFERRKRARHIHVSTDDGQVRKNLRQLGEPICLFGEGPADRRTRLRDILSKLGEDAIERKQEEEESRLQQAKDQESTWYHEGPHTLKTARLWIAQYSLPRAKERLKLARLDAEQSETTKTARKNETHKKAQAVSIYCSQIGDTRPISHCEFSPNSQYLVTSSWSGICKLWSVPSCELMQTYRGHSCNSGCIVFHPRATIEDTGTCQLASCAADGTIKLWSLDKEDPVLDLDGCSPHRVSKVAFHPSGRFLGACVYDSSWRLWDLEQQREVLHQEGHTKEVHCIAFQQDGSVSATGGLDSFGRVWDLRTGRCIMFMEGHLKPIYSIDFSPNCYEVSLRFLNKGLMPKRKPRTKFQSNQPTLQ